MKMRVLVMVLLGNLLACALGSNESNGSNGNNWSYASYVSAEPALRVWFTDLQDGYREAMARQQPIFVRVGGPNCPWCRKLDIEIETPSVQEALAGWTLVSIDADSSPNDALRLNARSIPALRVLSPSGRLVASRDGYLSGDELKRWLQGARDDVAAPADEVLLSNQEPSPLDVARIVRRFRDRDPALREAAVRRLAPFNRVAGAAVVGVMREGNLASRLVAFELLSQWQAPLDELDPWRPETITPVALERLDTWLNSIDAQPVHQVVRPLTPEQLDEARNEINRLLSAEPTEISAIRERLARFGPSLAPTVIERTQSASSDQDRQRLTHLRYRLAANDALVLTWPGGLERLASPDAIVRRQAAEELAARATDDQQALLLELFSDADPLVREISLRGLQHAGGTESKATLVRLLNDPEPNVRAAVLKLLAETNPQSLIDQVAEYVEKETDADLVVHAIRYFRETDSTKGMSQIVTLLEHENWRVRGEAAEAIALVLEGQDAINPIINPPVVRAALLRRLYDDDAFVVSQALRGLVRLANKDALEPLMAAATKFPTLVSSILEVIDQSAELQTYAIPHLRAFQQHADPKVRAVAIEGLSRMDVDRIQHEFELAFADHESIVRTAAATAFLKSIEFLRPREIYDAKNSSHNSFFDPELTGEKEVDAGGDADADSETTPMTPLDRWLTETYSGKHRRKWTQEMFEPLQALLTADQVGERLAAATALLPLGKVNDAIPVIEAAVAEQPELLGQSAPILSWLTWPDRIKLFRKFYDMTTNGGIHATLVDTMRRAHDVRAAEVFWELLERPQVEKSTITFLQQGLSGSYFAHHEYDPTSMPARDRKRLVAAITPHINSGSAVKRIVAIELLLRIAPENAIDGARHLMDDPTASEALRSDAWQIVLAALPKREREIVAVEAIAGSDAHRRLVALKWLAFGDSALSELPGTGYRMDLPIDNEPWPDSSDGINLDPPRGIKVEQLRPLVDNPDPQTSAMAGYLLTLFQDAEGLTPLLNYWRAQSNSHDFDRLVVRSISALNDTQRIPILVQIYSRLPAHDKREFYTTIHSMTGREILALRKRIRREVGASNLQ